MPYEIMEITDAELNKPRFRSECTAAYIATVRGFILNEVARRAVKIRERHGMFGAEERQEEWDEYTDLSMGATRELCSRNNRVTLLIPFGWQLMK
jgi:DNA-directed RNA polymerase III subunit RPC1